MPEAKPFLKWVGGKTQLLDRVLAAFPEKIETYYEPFLGGGSVFFSLATQKRFRRATINDLNAELINCYRTVRDFPQDLMSQLMVLPYEREVFEAMRKRKPENFNPVRRAARTIYLNKTCFNGLYRVNKAGEFNVPFGKFASPPKLFEDTNIVACSELLNHYVRITNTDYSMICEQAVAGDLIYFDPPYVPLNPTSSFTSYTAQGFGLQQQERLARLFRTLANKGVAVVLSNSDTPLVRELYDGFEIRAIQARRSINSKGDKRGPVGEVLVVANGRPLQPSAEDDTPSEPLGDS